MLLAKVVVVVVGFLLTVTVFGHYHHFTVRATSQVCLYAESNCKGESSCGTYTCDNQCRFNTRTRNDYMCVIEDNKLRYFSFSSTGVCVCVCVWCLCVCVLMVWWYGVALEWYGMVWYGIQSDI